MIRTCPTRAKATGAHSTGEEEEDVCLCVGVHCEGMDLGIWRSMSEVTEGGVHVFSVGDVSASVLERNALASYASRSSRLLP